MDEALSDIDRALGEATQWGERVALIRLEASLWNAIRRSTASRRRYVFPERPRGEPRRPRLFGVEVVADETLAPGTWRLEH
jgi:hypothetical protein